MTNQDQPPTGGAAGAAGRSLTDRISATMLEEILSASLRPGDLVLEGDIARRYGVSKTPVREALRHLADRGWILTIPRRGYLVRPLRLHDVTEVFELRLLLEPGLFAQAVRAAGDAQLVELTALVDRASHDDTPDDSRSSAGREFHLAVIRLAGNDRATAIVTNLLQEVRRLHHLMPDARTHPETVDVTSDHRSILTAIASGDADNVRELVRGHIQDSAARVLSAFRLTMQ